MLAHDGVLSFESSQESGTCFTASMPRHVFAGETKPVVPCPTKDRTAGASARSEKTVLIVEDDRTSRVALGDLLRDFGYQVRAASTPSEALKLVGRHDDPVHVLLTDVRLPEMGGEELAARLRDSQPDLEVFFMSGLSEPPAGACSAFFQKPIDIDALAEALERVVA
jgi:CheY-like chemotaxis protein